MKKLPINNVIGFMAILLLGVIVLMQTSCKKNGSDGGAPSITSFRLYKAKGLDSLISKDSAINALRPGDYIVIQGKNLNGVQAVYFDGFAAPFNPTFSSSSNFVVQVPLNIPFASIPADQFNTVKVVTSSGTALVNFPIVAPKPLIASISNEMPNPGDQLTIYGNGLFAITSLTLPGNVSVPLASITSDIGGSSSTFKLPAGFAKQSGPITIETKYGNSTSTVLLNDESRILTNFDNINNYAASDGTASIINNAALYPGNQGYYARMTFASMSAGDWGDGGPGRRIVLNSVQWVPVANVNDPTSNWALKFEIFAKNPWISGCMFIHDWTWGRTCRFEPWKVSGSYQTTGWTTITIPLSNFKTKPTSGPTAYIDGTGEPAATVKDLIGATGSGRLGFFLDNALVPVNNFDIAIDNIRIVKIK